MTGEDARRNELSKSALAYARRWLTAAAMVATVALTACGGGGSEGIAPPPGNGSPPPTVPPTVPPTRNEAARFLTQSTFGPAPADVERGVALG